MLLVAILCQAPTIQVTVAGEVRAESLRYRFENPSRFDTADLVPHFFEQTYDTDHTWLRVAVRHRVFGAAGRLEAAATPAATRRADDFDTFYQPDGNVVVSGTTGTATLGAWTLSEALMLADWRGFAIGLRYEYRRDHARFNDGDGITTTSTPRSVTHRLVTTRETTTSQIHTVSWLAEREQTAGRHGTVAVRVNASPVALARLIVELPDKYPGQRLAYQAKVAAVGVDVRYRRALGGWMVGAGVRGERTLTWVRDAQVHLSGASLLVEFGRR